MTVLLTFLSALELVVLLVALAIALYRIQSALDSINVNASKIMIGPRGERLWLAREGICQVAGQPGTITGAMRAMARGMCAEVPVSGLQRIINPAT